MKNGFLKMELLDSIRPSRSPLKGDDLLVATKFLPLSRGISGGLLRGFNLHKSKSFHRKILKYLCSSLYRQRAGYSSLGGLAIILELLILFRIFYLLYKTAQIGVRYIFDFRFIVNTHQRDNYLILSLLP